MIHVCRSKLHTNMNMGKVTKKRNTVLGFGTGGVNRRKQSLKVCSKLDISGAFYK